MNKALALANKARIQQETKQSWLNNNGVGCAELATGSGKSKIGLDCLQEVRASGPAKTLLVTPTEGMRDTDWPDEFVKWQCPMDDVKLICQASLAKERLEKYDFIILDEYHNNTVPVLKKLFSVVDSHNPKILALTATLPKASPWPKDQERIGMLHTLAPTIYKLPTDDAVDLGIIADFEVKVLKYKLDSDNHNITVKRKGYSYTTTEASRYKELTKELQRAMYSNNEAFKFMAMQNRVQFIYNLPSKTRLAKACIEKMVNSDKRTLVMAGSIEQINKLCGDAVFHSETSDTYLNEFQEGNINLLGAVKSLDEGKNLNKLDQLLITQVQSTERRLVQRIGRVVRMDYDNIDRKALIVILVACSGEVTQSCDEKWYRAAIDSFDTKRIHEAFYKLPPI